MAAELAPMTSGIAEEHSEVISALEALYGLLIDLGYVQNTDVQVPPHGLPKDPVAVAPLRAAGLDPATIELIGKLPCFTNEIIALQRRISPATDGIAIAPLSSATSYLLGSDRHDEAREVGVGPSGEKERLPSTAFKLATTTAPAGYNLAYDLDDKSIIEWHHDGWAERHRVPVSDFMLAWIRKLREREWTPLRNDSGWEIRVPRQNGEA